MSKYKNKTNKVSVDKAETLDISKEKNNEEIVSSEAEKEEQSQNEPLETTSVTITDKAEKDGNIDENEEVNTSTDTSSLSPDNLEDLSELEENQVVEDTDNIVNDKDKNEEDKDNTTESAILKPKDNTLVVKDKTNQRKAIKIATIIIGVVLFLCICWVIRYNSNSKNYLEQKLSQYDSTATDWVLNFALGKYNDCDMLVENYNDCIMNGKVSSSDNYVYYLYAIEQLSNSIKDIEVLSSTENTDGITYEIQITYTPFQIIETLNTDGVSVDDMKEKYIKGEMSNSEVQSTLEDIYLQVYKDSCFIPTDSTQTKIIFLTEKESNGVTYVLGTVSFLNEFLQDSNVLSNTDYFEEQVNETIADLLRN